MISTYTRKWNWIQEKEPCPYLEKRNNASSHGEPLGRNGQGRGEGEMGNPHHYERNWFIFTCRFVIRISLPDSNVFGLLVM